MNCSNSNRGSRAENGLRPKTRGFVISSPYGPSFRKKQIDPACAQSSAHTMMIPLSGIGLSADDSNNRLGSTRSGTPPESAHVPVTEHPDMAFFTWKALEEI